jgi:hypothetical protein
VFTSDHALKLEWLPNWIAIIGSGYIGLEFSDVYTALGTEVTFIEVRFWEGLKGGEGRRGGVNGALGAEVTLLRWAGRGEGCMEQRSPSSRWVRCV